MDIQQPYRILAPVHGPFKDGGQYANYFAPYTTAYTTQEIFLCNGKLAEDPLNGALVLLKEKKYLTIYEGSYYTCRFSR
jgi:hypothetical protein